MNAAQQRFEDKIKNDPEFHAQYRSKRNAYWAKPENKARRNAQDKARRDRQDVKEKKAAAYLRRMSDPEARKLKRSRELERIRKRQQDPVHGEVFRKKRSKASLPPEKWAAVLKRGKVWRSRPDVGAKIKKRTSELYAQNPEIRERRKKYAKAFRQTPMGKAMAFNHGSKRRAVVEGGSLTNAEICEMKKAAKICPYCGAKFSRSILKVLDHIQPLARGGTHSKDNVVVCCRHCNSVKHAKTAEEWAKIVGMLLI